MNNALQIARAWSPRAALALILLAGVEGVESVAGPAGPGEAGFGVPGANTQVANLVPFETIRSIALHKAREVWGPVSPGRPIECSDEDGDLVAYAWPFRLGTEPFPTYRQVMEGVLRGRSVLGSMETGPSSASASDVPPSGRERIAQARRRAIGAGEYGTVYVSARYDKHPVPLVSHYLSPYYTTGDLAQAKAKDVLKSSSLPKLSRVYFLGRRGQYFEFSDGPAAVVIHAQSLELEGLEPSPKTIPPPEVLDTMRREWEALAASARGGER